MRRELRVESWEKRMKGARAQLELKFFVAALRHCARLFCEWGAKGVLELNCVSASLRATLM